jgi:hypothetical protein
MSNEEEIHNIVTELRSTESILNIKKSRKRYVQARIIWRHRYSIRNKPEEIFVTFGSSVWDGKT